MLHTLTTTTRKKKRLGRGGARGRKSGRGDKGQRSRAGHRIRPAIRDELQRIPKRRGHNRNRARGIRAQKRVRVVTLGALARNFAQNDTITPRELVSRRIITRLHGRDPEVTIVNRGELSQPLTIRRCRVSASARTQIEKVGGSVH